LGNDHQAHKIKVIMSLKDN